MWLTSLLLSVAVPTAASVAASPLAQSPAYTYDNSHVSSLTTDAPAERGPPVQARRATTRIPDGLRPLGTFTRTDGRVSPSIYGYDNVSGFVQTARGGQAAREGHSTSLVARVFVERSGVAANGADNVVNGTRLGQQLARESADSVFTSSGRLSSGAIADSKEIISGSRLGNKDLISRLTSDGSDIADWGKYTTRTHQSPSGDFQVHFYMNRSTGAIDYRYDYKVIFNGAR